MFWRQHQHKFFLQFLQYLYECLLGVFLSMSFGSICPNKLFFLVRTRLYDGSSVNVSEIAAVLSCICILDNTFRSPVNAWQQRIFTIETTTQSSISRTSLSYRHRNVCNKVDWIPMVSNGEASVVQGDRTDLLIDYIMWLLLKAVQNSRKHAKAQGTLCIQLRHNQRGFWKWSTSWMSSTSRKYKGYPTPEWRREYLILRDDLITSNRDLRR